MSSTVELNPFEQTAPGHVVLTVRESVVKVETKIPPKREDAMEMYQTLKFFTDQLGRKLEIGGVA